MASMTMTASFLGGAAATISKNQPSTTVRRGVVMAKAAKVGESVSFKNDGKEESSNNNGRRDLVFAAAAAAVCSVAKIAMADEEEPKRGTAAAKKKYNVVCVTMPTAKVCHY